MNWTVHGVVTLNEEHTSLADEVCEHLRIGDKAYFIGEQDSFGPVTRFYYCSDCHLAEQEREDAELVYCNDCGCEKPRSDVLAWRWYDFYAPQGDEPIMVCSECRKKAKHLNRVAKDKADRDWELGLDQPEEDDFYY